MYRYIKEYYKYVNCKKRVDFQIHIMESKSELYEKRILMTEDEYFSKNIKDNRDKYENNAGCLIIPPKIKSVYDVLLTQGNDIYYKLWHEMTHAYNLIEIMQKDIDYIQIYSNKYFNNFDEFGARYISTVILFKHIMCKYNLNVFPLKNAIPYLEMLLEEVTDKELQNEEILRYNLMQYLGFFAAMEDFCNEKVKISEKISSNEYILTMYNCLKNYFDEKLI